MAFWHWAHSDKCFFQLLIPELTPVSLLESKSGFEIVTQLADTGKRSSSHLQSMDEIDWIVFQNEEKVSIEDLFEHPEHLSRLKKLQRSTSDKDTRSGKVSFIFLLLEVTQQQEGPAPAVPASSGFTVTSEVRSQRKYAYVVSSWESRWRGVTCWPENISHFHTMTVAYWTRKRKAAMLLFTTSWLRSQWHQTVLEAICSGHPLASRISIQKRLLWILYHKKITIIDD